MTDSGQHRDPGRPRISGLDEEILEATLRVLARDGYIRMTMDEVAREAGTTRPTVYRRHPSKADLATAALGYLRMQSPQIITGDLREELVAELRAFVTGISRPNGVAMAGLVLAEEHHTPELLENFRRQTVHPRRETLRAILHRADERGKLRADLDIEVLVTMIIGSFYAWYLDSGFAPPDWPERVVAAVLPSLLIAEPTAAKRATARKPSRS